MSKDRPVKSEALQALLQALRRMSAEAALLSELIADRIGINETDLKCLCLIDPGVEITAGELAGLTGLTTGAVTGLIDRLEKAGFVERGRDPGDRRKVIVRTVPECGFRIEPHFEALSEAMQALCAGYSDAELTLLKDFCTNSRWVLRDERLRMRGAGEGRERPPLAG
jgi:DNA-binding MarR family transcriptional regulator